MMKLTPKLLNLTLVGAEWVLWLLLVLSILSIALIIERALYFFSVRVPTPRFIQNLRRLLRSKDIRGAREYLQDTRGIEAGIITAGLEEVDYGMPAVEDAMMAAKIRSRIKLERNLSFLGTLGSNSPFVGLFGTVLGIIKAFRDLVGNQASGIGVVMSGISEALVATAVGLFVAIPAVVAFNAYSRLVRTRMAEADATVEEVLALLREEAQDRQGPASEKEKA